VYFEPTTPVRSRSGDDCVVCLTDQWYIDYAQPEWKKQVADHIENTMETYGDEMKALLLQQVCLLVVVVVVVCLCF
jgi:leucyl-tRNA synthetase